MPDLQQRGRSCQCREFLSPTGLQVSLCSQSQRLLRANAPLRPTAASSCDSSLPDVACNSALMSAYHCAKTYTLWSIMMTNARTPCDDVMAARSRLTISLSTQVIQMGRGFMLIAHRQSLSAVQPMSLGRSTSSSIITGVQIT